MEKLNYLVAGYYDFQTSASFSYVLQTMLETFEICALLVFMQHRIPKNAVAFTPQRTPQIALRNISYQNLHKHVERCRFVGQFGEPTQYLDTGILIYF